MRIVTEPYYLKKLKTEFARKQRINPAYSLRAYARQLAIHPGTLSSVFSGQRALPHKKALTIAKALQLTGNEWDCFINSLRVLKHGLKDLAKEREPEVDLVLKEDLHCEIIAEWEHYALLSLIKLSDFESDPLWIAKRLGITPSRTRVVIENLLKYGLLKKNLKGELQRTHARIDTTNEKTSKALQQSHKEVLRLAQQKIDEVPLELRGYYSETLAITTDQISLAKNLINEFRIKLSAAMDIKKPTDVYQFNIQFFPLTPVSIKQEKIYVENK